MNVMPETFTGPGIWSRADITESMWTVKLDRHAQAEIAQFVDYLRRSPVPLFLIDPADYEMPACREAVARARHILNQGVGFVLLDRLDLDGMSAEEGRAAYWLICNMLSRPVAQSLSGTIIHEVFDSGKRAEPGSSVRPNATNQDIVVHNDNAFNVLMPDYVGLLCVRAAKLGGHSRVMHLNQLYNVLHERYPEVLPRLFEPFWLFRNGQHAPEEPPVISEPMFRWADARLTARFGIHMVLGGYKTQGEPLDTRAHAALDALDDVFNMEEFIFEFSMERGQIQFVHNLQVGHSRTEFSDHDDPALKRRLLRMWMREAGRPNYLG